MKKFYFLVLVVALCLGVGSVLSYGSSGNTWTDSASGLTWQVKPAYHESVTISSLSLMTIPAMLFGLPSSMYWKSAQSYCKDLSLDGFSDWHLPTISELRTLIRSCPATETGGACQVTHWCSSNNDCWWTNCYGCSRKKGPGRNKNYLPRAIRSFAADTYWSSTTDSDHGVWIIGVDRGAITLQGSDSRLPHHVRCVRSEVMATQGN